MRKESRALFLGAGNPLDDYASRQREFCSLVMFRLEVARDENLVSE